MEVGDEQALLQIEELHLVLQQQWMQRSAAAYGQRQARLVVQVLPIPADVEPREVRQRAARWPLTCSVCEVQLVRRPPTSLQASSAPVWLCLTVLST